MVAVLELKKIVHLRKVYKGVRGFRQMKIYKIKVDL